MIGSKNSISRNLIFSLVTAITIVFILLIGSNYYISIKNERDKLISNGKSSMKQFSKVLIDPIWRLNIEEINRLSRLYLKSNNIVYINVSFEDSKITMKSDNYNPNFVQKLSETIKYRNEIIGTADLYITEERIIKRQREILSSSLIVFIVIILVVVFTVNILIKRVLEVPIADLMVNLGEIAKGNYDYMIQPVEQTELNRIITEINSMSNQIYLRDKQLKETKQYLQDFIESMPSILIGIDMEGKITRCNKSALQCMATQNSEIQLESVNPKDVVGNEFWLCFPFLEKYKSIYYKVFEMKEPLEFHREMFKSFKNRYFNVSIFPLVKEEAKGVVIRIDDFTEMELKEQQLRQAQKMETIGTLAGGLAHDFNNVLGGISGTASLLRVKMDTEKDIKLIECTEHIEIIEKSSENATEMVKQLLSLSRKHELTFVPFNLNNTVKHVISICSNTFDKSIELKTEYYNQIARVLIDPNLIEQSLLNICVNASHAMTIMRKDHERQGGILEISINVFMADKDFITLHPEAKEIGYYNLSVRDTGIGMDKKTVAKIFEPFFTTKEKGKGTGLGLSMVNNIILQHNGFIDVYSEKSIGTIFKIYIPILTEEMEEGGVDKKSNIFKGTGIILVVDDEKLMQVTAKSILEQCGYDVITADDGIEGINLFIERHHEIKAVLLDLVMPKKSGEETFLEMNNINGNVPVLLSSGFKRNERIDKAIELGVKGFLQKPYSIENLSFSISEIIKNQ